MRYQLLIYADEKEYAAIPKEGLLVLESIRQELDTYAPFYLAQADMLLRLEQKQEATDMYRIALTLTLNEVEKEFIRKRISDIEKELYN